MPSYASPKKNTAYITYISLYSQANTANFQVNPTIASGDFKISIDGGAVTNLTNLPTITPAGSVLVKLDITASEMNGDNINIIASDQAGAEWNDLLLSIPTTTLSSGEANVIQWNGTVVATPATAGIPEVNLKNIANAAVSTSTAQLGVNVVNIGGTAAASATIGTVTNLTNAATAGDLTSTMKTSVENTIWNAVRASHTTAGTFGEGAASVQGNVTGSAASVTGAVGSVTAGVTVATNNDKTGYSIAAGGIGSGANAAAELNNIADATLDRNMATGTDSGTNSTAVRTLRQAARLLRNKASISAATLTVTKEDDSTTSWTAGISTTAGNPISAVDPA